MLGKIGRSLRERRFKRAARQWLTAKYGDVFTWRAALRLEGASDEHVFSAMARDMSAVCEAVYLEPDCTELTDGQRAQLEEAAFCMAVFPAGTDKLLIVPELKNGAVREWYADARDRLGKVTLTELGGRKKA